MWHERKMFYCAKDMKHAKVYGLLLFLQLQNLANSGVEGYHGLVT